jgi:hypothetical protein
MLLALEVCAEEEPGLCGVALSRVGCIVIHSPRLQGCNQLTVTVPKFFCERTVPEEFVTTALTV